jgi:uncharacterized membrane protein YtjA (UPF0391 family)
MLAAPPPELEDIAAAPARTESEAAMFKLAYYSLITAALSGPVHLIARAWPTKVVLVASLVFFVTFLTAGLRKGP